MTESCPVCGCVNYKPHKRGKVNEKMAREAVRMARESRPSNEELAEIRASALRAARAARPSREEMEAIRETARQARDEHRVHLEQAREEMRLRRIELEEQRVKMHESRLENSPIDREQKEPESGSGE